MRLFQCPFCGGPLGGNEKFCPRCGRRVGKRGFKWQEGLLYGLAVLVLAAVWLFLIIPALRSGNRKDPESGGHQILLSDPNAEEESSWGEADWSGEESADWSALWDTSAVPDEGERSWEPEEQQPLPDVVGMTYEAGVELLPADRWDISVDYVFSDEVNRGCIIDAQWEDNGIRLAVSWGREYTYTTMKKRDANGAVEYVDEYQYRGDGTCYAADKRSGSGTLQYRFEPEYDEYGVETGQAFYSPDGAYHHSWEFQYDDYGRIVLSRKYIQGGEELQREEYEYDSKGRLTSRKDYQKGHLTYVWDVTQYDDAVSPLSYTTHIGNNWIYADIYDASGKWIRYATQEFDELGAIESMNIWVASDDRLVYQYLFQSAYVGQS